MNDLITEHKSKRETILAFQNHLLKAISDGTREAGIFPLTHHFTPVDEKYGCCVYARELFIPKGSELVGKIHKYTHLNFVMAGEILVATEFGKKHIKAPCIFVSEPGIKRAGYALEDTIWVTVHLTEHCGEEKLDAIEDEVIAKSYEEFDLIEATKQLPGASE